MALIAVDGTSHDSRPSGEEGIGSTAEEVTLKYLTGSWQYLMPIQHKTR